MTFRGFGVDEALQRDLFVEAIILVSKKVYGSFIRVIVACSAVSQNLAATLLLLS